MSGCATDGSALPPRSPKARDRGHPQLGNAPYETRDTRLSLPGPQKLGTVGTLNLIMRGMRPGPPAETLLRASAGRTYDVRGQRGSIQRARWAAARNSPADHPRRSYCLRCLCDRVMARGIDAYSSPDRPASRFESSQENSETPSARATHAACSSEWSNAAERCGAGNERPLAAGRAWRTNSNAPPPKTTTASRMPGMARFHGNGMGGGAVASSRTRSITEARKPEVGTRWSSVARI